MKIFVLLILIICLVIDDDDLVIAKSKNVNKCEIKSNDIFNAVENLLKVKIKKLEHLKNDRCQNGHSIFKTTQKKILFVKSNSNNAASKMFEGEFESLKTIRNTETVLVPRPLITGHTKHKNNLLVLEYMNMTANVTLTSELARELGSKLADLHLYNFRGNHPTVNKFGFHINTYSGSVPQENSWTNDWLTFFIENRLVNQLKLLRTMNTTLNENIIAFYWNNLKPKIPKLFEGVDVKPSLLHGNLWSKRNIAHSDSKPVLLNPASFYGHHEYDIAAITSLDCVPRSFYEAYYKKIPKAEGADKRSKLYALFHYINHWNQAKGPGMRIIETVNELVDKFDPVNTKN